MTHPSSTGHPLGELLSFLDGQTEASIVMDSQYRILGANKAYRRAFGQDTPIIGRCCYEVSHHFTVPCDQAGETCPLKRSQEDGEAKQVLHLHHTPRGEEHVAVDITPIHDSEGEIAYFVETLNIVQHASSQPVAEGLVGRSPPFNRMLEKVMRVAKTAAAVLLLGETGTGKELIARLLHETSRRAHRPFVAVDCSGLTETLFESELFGYEKGAFTGANQRKTGLVEAASGGTLFLDEVGDIPLPLQVKLLRLLETGTYRRVGGVETLCADFRLVCATHRDLKTMVAAEQFRRDLFHRIEVFPIHVPSLAERREDIPLLAESLLRRVAPDHSLTFSSDALNLLQARHYPGNIRELRNLIERASILADGSEISIEHLADSAFEAPAHSFSASPSAEKNHVFSLDTILPLSTLEQNYLRWAMERYSGGRHALAAALGLTPRTLFRKLSTVHRVQEMPPD